MSTQQLREEVLALPHEEQMALFHALRDRLEPQQLSENDQAWLDEASRRDAELDAHPGSEVSHEEVLKFLRR